MAIYLGKAWPWWNVPDHLHMHKESFEIMKSFVERYLDGNEKLEILDVGSFDVNGSYRPLFQKPNWNYCGLDMIAGPNVDLVSKSAYEFCLNDQYDVVISGNCLEHVEAPWRWIKEVEKVTKNGGLVCIVTPFSIGEHKYPLDCWRILPDGFRYLLEKESNFKVLETNLNIPSSMIKYKYITDRPKLKWILKFLPEGIKYLLEYQDAVTKDTYVIARKY